MRFAERRIQRSFETGRILWFVVASITALVVVFGVVMWIVDRKDFPTAVQTFGKYRALCVPHETCASNASIVFANWSIEHQRTGDWQSARKVLQDCVGELPSDSRCKDALSDLESRHRF